MASLHQAETCRRLMDPGQHVLAGIACLDTGAWQDALAHFDRAIALREATAWEKETHTAWGLAAAYLNRSDALRRLGRFPAAIPALRQAIAAMDHVPLAEHPAYPERLILAWTNLATALQENGETHPAASAFSTAASLLGTWGSHRSPTRTFLTAMFHTNRARFLLTTGNAVEAWKDAGQAVRLLDKLDPAPELVPASIQARGILCQSLAAILETPGAETLEEDWIARATDAAEEALQLARTSGYSGEWIGGLVRYCAKIYRICQPHFLAEFLCETFPPASPLAKQSGLLREMANELLLARAALEARVLASPHDTALVQKETATLRKLQLAEARLRTHAPAS